MDYIRVPGRAWVAEPDRHFDTVELRAPLIALIRRARAATLEDLPRAFSLPAGQLYRRDIPLIPDRVIREAVVNAVMHRSYRVQGAVQIIRYANRSEIRNPGHSLDALDRLGEPGSETRNPVIAAILHERNLAETKGSGIRVMRELMTETGLTPPAFESNREGNQVVATFLFHHFLTPKDWAWLGLFGELGLSDKEARALVLVREINAINNAAYRNLNQVDVLNASLHLRRLRDHGLLLQKGKGSETYYVPTPKMLDAWRGELAPELKIGSAGPTSQPQPLSIQSGPLSIQSDPVSKPPAALLHQSDGLMHHLPGDLNALVNQLGRRAEPVEVPRPFANCLPGGRWASSNWRKSWDAAINTCSATTMAPWSARECWPTPFPASPTIRNKNTAWPRGKSRANPPGDYHI